LSIESIFQRIGWNFGPKLPFHCIALLNKDKAIYLKLATGTQTLLAATIREKARLAEIAEQIKTLLKTATPLREAIQKIETQLDEKVTEANNAKQLEATAARCSKVQLECHCSSGKAFIKAMKAWHKFSEWKTTNSNRNIGPQTEAILLVLFDIPCFFSRSELEVFLGYTSPNHNVIGAVTKMVEEKMLIIATNKVGTEVYTIWETSADSHSNAANYQMWIADQINTRHPSSFAQITEPELETKDKLRKEYPSTTSNKSH
jgi:hypothetical protein